MAKYWEWTIKLKDYQKQRYFRDWEGKAQKEDQNNPPKNTPIWKKWSKH